MCAWLSDFLHLHFHIKLPLVAARGAAAKCYFVWGKGLITRLDQHPDSLAGSAYAPLVGNGRADVLSILVKSQNRLSR